jgi:hypothetical protein
MKMMIQVLTMEGAMKKYYYDFNLHLLIFIKRFSLMLLIIAGGITSPK